MSYRVLISAPYMHKEKEKVTAMLSKYDWQIDWAVVEERLEESDLLEVIANYDGIICGDDRITRRVIDSATNLKAIVKWGTGVDSIDCGYAESRGIKVCRTPGAFTEPVSDTTVGLMLGHVRTTFLNDRIIKSGGWDKPQGYTLAERTVGIIGFGDIGQAVARKLLGFGPNVLVNDLKKIPVDLESSLNVKVVSKEEIYKKADIITLHCDLNEESEHLLDKAAFDKMERIPFIINTARGPIIKESDLINAIELKQIAGAGLDVFEFEPLPESSPIRKMDNVVTASHNSNSSPRCWGHVHENSISMLAQGLEN